VSTPTEPFAALKAEPASSLEFWGNKKPRCPHCGESHSVSENEWWRLYEEGEHEVTCPDCDGDFTVSTSVTYSFSTEQQEGV
jgi:transposase-like protein